MSSSRFRQGRGWRRKGILVILFGAPDFEVELLEVGTEVEDTALQMDHFRSRWEVEDHEPYPLSLIDFENERFEVEARQKMDVATGA